MRGAVSKDKGQRALNTDSGRGTVGFTLSSWLLPSRKSIFWHKIKVLLIKARIWLKWYGWNCMRPSNAHSGAVTIIIFLCVLDLFFYSVLGTVQQGTMNWKFDALKINKLIEEKVIFLNEQFFVTSFCRVRWSRSFRVYEKKELHP